MYFLLNDICFFFCHGTNPILIYKKCSRYMVFPIIDPIIRATLTHRHTPYVPYRPAQICSKYTHFRTIVCILNCILLFWSYRGQGGHFHMSHQIADIQYLVHPIVFLAGCAFTRFQTLRLTKVFPSVLNNHTISYGPCQFPTLGFVVDRVRSSLYYLTECIVCCVTVVQTSSVIYSWNIL